MKYQISWVSRDARTPISGLGAPVFDTYDDAARCADEMNKKYPELEHVAIPALESPEDVEQENVHR